MHVPARPYDKFLDAIAIRNSMNAIRQAGTDETKVFTH
jgi:hypothetical protein